MTGWPARAIAALATLGVGACSGGGGDSSNGSCRPPRPILSPTEVSSGESLAVTIDYRLTCRDGNGPVQPPDTGWHAVRVILVQGGREILLAVADADDNGQVRVTVPVPAGVTAGPAVVRADSTEDAELTVQ